MTTVTVRDLRNRGAEVLDTVARGESVTVTRDGVVVAELRHLPRRGPSGAQLIERRRHLPRIDPERFLRDIDAFIDPPCEQHAPTRPARYLLTTEHEGRRRRRSSVQPAG